MFVIFIRINFHGEGLPSGSFISLSQKQRWVLGFDVLGTTLTLLCLVFEVTGKNFQLAALTVLVPDIYLRPYLFGSWVRCFLGVWDHSYWDDVASPQLGWQLWPQLWGWPWLCHHPDTELVFPSLSFTSNHSLGHPALRLSGTGEMLLWGNVHCPVRHPTKGQDPVLVPRLSTAPVPPPGLCHFATTSSQNFAASTGNRFWLPLSLCVMIQIWSWWAWGWVCLPKSELDSSGIGPSWPPLVLLPGGAHLRLLPGFEPGQHTPVKNLKLARQSFPIPVIYLEQRAVLVCASSVPHGGQKAREDGYVLFGHPQHFKF